MIYMLALAVTLTIRGANELPVRYLAPLYVPALVVAMLGLNEFFRWAERQKPLASLPFLQNWNTDLAKRITISGPALILMAGLVLWLSQQVYVNYRNIGYWQNNGYGYSSREWADSEVVHHLRAHPPVGRILTNQAVALHLLLDIQGQENIFPLGASTLSNPRPWTAKSLVKGEDTYFVWFHQGFLPEYGYGHGEIGALPGIETVALMEDGVILRLKAVDNGSGGTSELDEEPLLQPILKDARPVIRSVFDVYLDEKRNMLIYAKDECSYEDVAPKFFLHIVPIDEADLPENRREYGYYNMDFTSTVYEFWSEGLCVAKRDLPDYGIAEIRTGQYVREAGQLWREVFHPNE